MYLLGPSCIRDDSVASKSRRIRLGDRISDMLGGKQLLLLLKPDLGLTKTSTKAGYVQLPVTLLLLGKNARE